MKTTDARTASSMCEKRGARESNGMFFMNGLIKNGVDN